MREKDVVSYRLFSNAFPYIIPGMQCLFREKIQIMRTIYRRFTYHKTREFIYFAINSHTHTHTARAHRVYF